MVQIHTSSTRSDDAAVTASSPYLTSSYITSSHLTSPIPIKGRSDNAIKNRWHLIQRASIQRSRDSEKEKKQLLATKLQAAKLEEMMMMNHHTTSTMRPLQCSDAKSSSSLSSTSSVSHEECTLSIDSHVDIDRDFVMVSCAELSSAVLSCADLL